MYPGGSVYNGRNRSGRGGGGGGSGQSNHRTNEAQPNNNNNNAGNLQYHDPSILSVGAAASIQGGSSSGNVLGALSALAQANPHAVVGQQQQQPSRNVVTLSDPPKREPIQAPRGQQQQQPQRGPQQQQQASHSHQNSQRSYPQQHQQQHQQQQYGYDNNNSYRGRGGSYHDTAARGGGYNGGGRGGSYRGGADGGVQHVVAGPAYNNNNVSSNNNGYSSGPPVQRQKLQEGGMLNINAKKDYDAIVRAFIENPTMFEIEFPSTLTPTERHHVHKLAMHFNVDHKSHGVGVDRVLRLTKKGGGVAAASGGTTLSAADHRRLLFTPAAPAAKALPPTRVKSVDMYQGAQFLEDSWFESHCKELLANSIAPLHQQMVKEIRTQMQFQRPTRNFRPVQPGLSHPPARPAKAQAEMEALQAFRARLPTTLQKDKIIDAVRNNRVTVISGDTGCGKTTQIPQLLYDSNIFGNNRGQSDDVVLCTQPRRISALSVAARVASERGQACGDEVGYIIRFENQTSHATRVVYLTTGILLRRLHNDPELRGVNCVVVDEVHERDVDTDFALLLLREILIRDPKRNLKIVVMSATIQVERLVDYFFTANHGRKPPLIAIPGTLFRVEDYFLDDALQWFFFLLLP
ncbi:ATP-dependent DEAD/DEAH box RNA helicase, putative [Bodo saltans]|uniref:ATP-dependent DEAD/DEAH box RNA helicase, putative n=1 Tax=Bodo saltans TaxID=75058 RepID=A0A0S4J8P0_BODSA|nr:ATP-dependent DEAD/DEAH box RNA helicase, putative [Bodo saltans]|eukprot:CUG86316.1 ATP-dependent DEAD/DEAH box RNA helicase, putative [Bodo saltans]